MMGIMFENNPNGDITEEDIAANIRTSENQKNAFRRLATPKIEDILVFHCKQFGMNVNTFKEVRKEYRDFAILVKRKNKGDDSLTDMDKIKIDNSLKIWDFMLTGMWKTGGTKEYEAAIEKKVMGQMNLVYATYLNNNREHLCCRKLVNRTKNVVRKKIIDTGKRIDVVYRRQGTFSILELH